MRHDGDLPSRGGSLVLHEREKAEEAMGMTRSQQRERRITSLIAIGCTPRTARKEALDEQEGWTHDTACPKCGSPALKVSARTWAALLPEGADPEGDLDFNADSDAMCDCGWEGKYGDCAIDNDPHTKDADCTVDPKTGCCFDCGVLHGDPCPGCGARGFHAPGCPVHMELP